MFQAKKAKLLLSCASWQEVAPAMKTCSDCRDGAQVRAQQSMKIQALETTNKSLRTRIQHLELELKVRKDNIVPSMDMTLEINFDARMKPFASWKERDDDQRASVSSSPLHKARRIGHEGAIEPSKSTGWLQPNSEDEGEVSHCSLFDDSQEEVPEK